MNKNKIILGIVALAVVIAGVAVANRSGLLGSSGPTHYQKESFLEGLYAGVGRVVEITRTGAVTLGSTLTQNGLATLNAGSVRSYTNATTTSATTYTLTEADILHYSTIIQTLSGGATTFTLPATSTITSLVPAVGDIEEMCWLPLSNSLTFAAGTGIDLETASSSPTDLTIGANNTGCMRFIRQADTDITVTLTEFTDGD